MTHKKSITPTSKAFDKFIKEPILRNYSNLRKKILSLNPEERGKFYNSFDHEVLSVKVELSIGIQRRLGNLSFLKYIHDIRRELDVAYNYNLNVCIINSYSTAAIINSLILTMDWGHLTRFDERIPYSSESAKALSRLCKDLNLNGLGVHNSTINDTLAETASVLGRIRYDLELLFKMEDLLLADEVYGELNSPSSLEEGITLFPFRKSGKSKYVQRLFKLKVERFSLQKEAEKELKNSVGPQPEVFMFKTSNLQTRSKTDGISEIELDLHTFKKLGSEEIEERKEGWKQLEKELYPKYFELLVNKNREWNHIQKIESEYQTRPFNIGGIQFSGNEILLATCAIMSYAQIIWTFNRMFNKDFLMGICTLLKNDYGDKFENEVDFQVWALRSIQEGWAEIMSLDGFELTVVRDELALIPILRRVTELDAFDDNELANLLHFLSGQKGGLLSTPLLHLGKKEYLIPINNFLHTNYLSTVYQGFISKHMYDTRKCQNKDGGLDKLRERLVLERLERKLEKLGAKVIINHEFKTQTEGECDLIISFRKEKILIIMELKLINCESEKFSRELQLANDRFLEGVSQLEKDLDHLSGVGSFRIRKKLALPTDWGSKWNSRAFIISDSYTVDRRNKKIEKWNQMVLAISLFELDQIVQELAKENSSRKGAKLLMMIDNNVFWSRWQKSMNLNLDQKTISIQNHSLCFSFNS